MHRIRLRGPWELVPLERSGGGPLPAAGRVEVPGDLSERVDPEFRGQVRLERRFNAPTNLDPGERVLLVFDRLDRSAEVTLNGTALVRNAQSPECHDIRPQLALHNRLEIVITLPADPLGEVRLELGP